MAKVLLIRPHMYYPKVAKEYFTILPPLGIAYIASTLEGVGHEVRVLDAFVEAWDSSVDVDEELLRIGLADSEISAVISEFKPMLVGISNPFSAQSRGMDEVAALVKGVDSDIKVVVGGVHPSSMPEQCMENEDIDFLIMGEGERPIQKLIESIEGSRALDSVDGLYYRTDSGLKFNGIGDVLRDLDKMPRPAYHLLPMEKYFAAAAMDMTTRGGAHDRWIHMITSRGCPYFCNFCSVHLMEGKKWRMRSPENIVDEMEFLGDEYGIKRFTIEDSNFTLDVKRAEKVCDTIISRGLNIKWSLPNGLRADRLPATLAMKMKEAGCIEITIAVEHGDQDFITNVIKKDLDLSKVEETVRNINKMSVPLSGFFIVGIPPENKETAGKTIAMVRRLARLGLIPQVNIAMPLPGTEMYDECVKNGYIPNDLTYRDFLFMAHSRPLIDTEFLKPGDLLALRRKAYLTGLFNLMLFHPIIFLRLPFIRATFSDLLRPSTFFKRLRKIFSIFYPEKLGG